MILVDPPRWPAHGTVFSHLVSDESLDELHSFAERLDLPPRAFDHDHYDLPERRYADAVDAGAAEVSGPHLVRRLVASGLRVRTPERTPKRAAATATLRARWFELGLDHPALGAGLIRRWSQAHRHYHDVRHLAAVLDALDALAPEPEAASLPVRLAAWFHDAVYDGVAGDDEEASALLAEHLLVGVVAADVVAEVARLVRLTATHAVAPTDDAGAALSDADLAILGSAPGRYDVYVRDVRQDYAHVPDSPWAIGRVDVLNRLLALEPLFRTATGRSLWAARAQENLLRERRRWSS